MGQDSAADLGQRAWLGWACAKTPPTDKDLQAALQHFAKKHGRPCELVALRERDGLTPPAGCELVGWATVPVGCLYLALPGEV
jgi:hypothetical protein